MTAVREPAQLTDDGPVLDHHALGATRTARGVDDVGEMLRGRHGRGRWQVALGGRVLRGEDRRAAWRQGGDPVAQVRLGDDDRGPGVLQHVAQPVLRVVRGQRQIGGTGGEDAPRADHQIEGRLGEQAHTGVGADPESGEPVAQVAATAVEFAVGEPGVAVVDGRRVGAQGGLVGEQVGQVAARERYAGRRCTRGLHWRGFPLLISR